jgi:hypothetical protein
MTWPAPAGQVHCSFQAAGSAPECVPFVLICGRRWSNEILRQLWRDLLRTRLVIRRAKRAHQESMELVMRVNGAHS